MDWPIAGLAVFEVVTVAAAVAAQRRVAYAVPVSCVIFVAHLVVTAGGLVFIAGTKDERIRAFDARTGQTLWQHPLPAGGYATPATYRVSGRQYVVIAAGGAGKLRTKAGDAFVAFGLPEGE